MHRPWLLAAALLAVATAGCASTSPGTDTADTRSAPAAGSDVGAPLDSATEPSTASPPPADTTEATEPPAAESSSTTIAGAAATGEAAPVDPVALVGGGQLDLGSIEGSDTVLWFWAPW